MKLTVIFLILLIPTISLAENYILTVGNDVHEIALDKEVRIKIGDSHVSVKLEENDTFLYTDESFSFEHPKEYSPSKSEVENGIFQTVVMSPLGSAVIIQEYSYIEPSSLMDLMVKTLTKEERAYGYKIESKKASTTLSDGKTLNGKVATSTYKNKDITRYFYAYSFKDSGLFIITIIDGVDPNGDSLVDQVISTLKITK